MHSESGACLLKGAFFSWLNRLSTKNHTFFNSCKFAGDGGWGMRIQFFLLHCKVSEVPDSVSPKNASVYVSRGKSFVWIVQSVIFLTNH